MTETCHLSSFAQTNVTTQSYSPLACTTSDRTTEGPIAVKTFRVTVSPKGHISIEVIRWILKTYNKNNKYVVVETGTSGQRHLHMLIQFDEPKQKKDLRDVFSRNIKKHHPDAIMKYALVINTCFDMKWYEEYLRKEAGVENVCTDEFDADTFRDALPDQVTQDALQAATRHRVVGGYWIDHEKRWIEYSPDDTTYDSAIRYFNHRMCVARDMEPITASRRLREMAYFLYKYRNKAVDVDMGDKAHFEKEFNGVNIFKTAPC